MRQLNIFMAIIALTFIAFFPAAARAANGLDDLDVTLVIVDNTADLGVAISKMDGPNLDDGEDAPGDDDSDDDTDVEAGSGDEADHGMGDIEGMEDDSDDYGGVEDDDADDDDSDNIDDDEPDDEEDDDGTGS